MKNSNNKHLTFEQYKTQRENGKIKSKGEAYTIFELFKEYLAYTKSK